MTPETLCEELQVAGGLTTLVLAMQQLVLEHSDRVQTQAGSRELFKQFMHLQQEANRCLSPQLDAAAAQAADSSTKMFDTVTINSVACMIFISVSAVVAFWSVYVPYLEFSYLRLQASQWLLLLLPPEALSMLQLSKLLGFLVVEESPSSRTGDEGAI